MAEFKSSEIIKEDKGKLNRRKMIKIGVGAGLGLVFGLIGCKPSTENLAKEELTEEEKKFAGKVNKILQGYSKLNRSSYENTVERLLLSSNDVILDLENLTKAKNSNIKYNAYFALILLASSRNNLENKIMPTLKEGLDDSEVYISATAAVGLIGLGEKDGLPSIISRMDSKYENVIMYAEPPARLPDYAYDVLQFYTDQNFGDDQAKWQKWWEDNQNNIQWNKEKDIFITLSK